MNMQTRREMGTQSHGSLAGEIAGLPVLLLYEQTVCVSMRCDGNLLLQGGLFMGFALHRLRRAASSLRFVACVFVVALLMSTGMMTVIAAPPARHADTAVSPATPAPLPARHTNPATALPSVAPAPIPSSHLTPPPAPTATATVAPPPSTPIPAGTPTFYVSARGNDAADGRTPQTAWRTFANVGNSGKVSSGAFVLAEAGDVWNEAVKAPANNVSFSVYGQGAKPKIIAPSGQYAFDNQWHQHTLLEGWDLTSADRKDAQMGIVIISGDSYIVRNIAVHGADPRLMFAEGNHGLIENSEFYDCNGSGTDSALTVFAHTDASMPSASESHVVQNNFFHDTGYRALELHGTAFLAQNNTFTRWSANIVGNVSQAPAGIYVTQAAPGTAIVQGNVFNGTGVENVALWVDTGPSGIIFTGNTVSNCRFGAWSEKSNNTVFRGNTFSGIKEIGIQWGDYPPEGPASVGGEISGNTFMGTTPTDGWTMVYKNGSTASVYNNVNG